MGAGGGAGAFHLVANKAFARFLPSPESLVGDAYAARMLPSILLAGYVVGFFGGSGRV